MVVVRGINVFPTQIAAVLNSFAELSGEYRILLEGRGPYDRLPVEAELAEGVGKAQNLADTVERRIKSELGVTARLALLPFNSLPRSEGKTRRVIRREDT
jgi:phenylacetate-CoA ligase